MDILRIIAVQLVLIGHGIALCGIFEFLQPPNFPYIQNIGVVIFFILSGFLITYSTVRKINNKGYSFKEYFIDRFSRIYAGLIPALLFILLLDYIFQIMFPENYIYYSSYNVFTLISNLFMLQNYPLLPFVATFGTGRPLWTLAIEWWIYMFFGWIIFRTVSKHINYKYLFVLFIFSIVPIYNLFGCIGGGLFLTWIFGMGIFVLLNESYLNINKLQTCLGLIICLIGSTTSIVICKLNVYNPYFGFFISISILLILYLFSKKKNQKNKKNAIVHLFAGYSYTLYLIHYSIFSFLVNFQESISTTLIFILGFLLSNICALFLAIPGEMKYRKLSAYLKRIYL
ncbi:acyltransferase [Methanogenium marinum]|uniref:Acyltransferase n=1 Tax=Methanogenium marinum TaxID=348610 RepID=A0A9Q4PV68_9EURY|nr:acyltransferase [Methanogenium marinum]MDE4907284.1 acyltransferase [Methanogenium marinum]